MMVGRILIVDDDPAMCEMLKEDLHRRGFSVTSLTSGTDALAVATTGEFDVVLTDVRLPGLSGVELCDRVVANRPDIPVVVMTAFGSLDTAIAAMRAGAYDFIAKPVRMEVLALCLERALRHASLQDKVRVLSEQIDVSSGYGELIGTSVPMQTLRAQIARVVESEASILIAGESGTGKEVVARFLHKQNRRRSGSFVPVNCAALPHALLESELFGHGRGAFTDAKTKRRGLFEEADGGTLFLDEIGEFPLTLQPKLLRALEERSVRPVGTNVELEVDFRVIAATNRDLETAMEEERFREDLYYRINVIRIDVPPLRSRGTDILLLASHFVRKFADKSRKAVSGVSRSVAERLLSYSWPGNVRELRNAMERAVALTGYEEIAVEDLPEKIRAYRASQVILDGGDPAELASLEEVEKRYILHVLKTLSGNRTRAALVLGLDRKTLYRKLRRYGAGVG